MRREEGRVIKAPFSAALLLRSPLLHDHDGAGALERRHGLAGLHAHMELDVERDRLDARLFDEHGGCVGEPRTSRARECEWQERCASARRPCCGACSALQRFPTMSPIATLTGHNTRVLYSALSPDGQTVVTVSVG